MKSKYRLLKILLIILAFVAAGVIYSCISSDSGNSEITVEEEPAESEPVLDMHDDGNVISETENTDLICVHVCGAVNNAGVYYLEEGSRVHEAVEMAGGFGTNAAKDFVNLADVVFDGEQIYIPTVDESEDLDIPYVSGKTDRENDGLVNINTAGVEELTTLTGIGESRAEAIIAYRENVSVFEQPEDIINVSGIGTSIYEKIKDSIKV